MANVQLISGWVVGIFDVEAAAAHDFVLLSNFARAGQLLLWNPWANAGSPEYLRDIGALSPLNTLLAFLIGGELMRFWLYWLALWFLGGLGMLLLARHLKAPAWAGVVVTLGFMFSGFQTGHAEHTPLIVSFSFLPWVIWRLDAALLSRRAWPAVEAGALWGLGALSGYPAFTVLTGCFAALWTAARYMGWRINDRLAAAPAAVEHTVPPASPHGPGPGYACLTVVLVLLAGLPVLAPTYFGLLWEGVGYSDRSGALPREIAVASNALHPAALASLASPYLAIFKMRNGLWMDNDLSSFSLYAGPLLPVLALLALLCRPRDAWRWCLLAIGLLCLSAALGGHLPVRGWLYDYFPPMRYFRHAAAIRGYWIFVVGVLALHGASDLDAAFRSTARAIWIRLAVAAAVVAAVAIAAYAVIALGSAPRHSASTDAWTHLLFVWPAVAVIGLAFVWMPPTWRKSLLPPLLCCLAAGDAIVAVNLSSPIMFSPAAEAWVKIDQQRDESLDLTPHGLRREYRFVGGPHYPFMHNRNYVTKVPALWSYGPLANHFHETLPTQSAKPPTARPWVNNEVLARSALGPDRIWFAAKVAEVGWTNAAYDALSSRASELRAPPLVIHSRAALLDARPADSEDKGAEARDAAAIAALPAAERLPATVTDYKPRHLALTVTTPADGWLLVTDRWARSWKATVNGVEQEVLAGNFLFRAIKVPAGTVKVEFTYQPLGWPWLLLLSWGTLIVVAAGALWFALAGSLRGDKHHGLWDRSVNR